VHQCSAVAHVFWTFFFHLGSCSSLGNIARPKFREFIFPISRCPLVILGCPYNFLSHHPNPSKVTKPRVAHNRHGARYRRREYSDLPHHHPRISSFVLLCIHPPIYLASSPASPTPAFHHEFPHNSIQFRFLPQPQ
jgi:hypothetical protein